jgi:arylsulfatase A-like enzyme
MIRRPNIILLIIDSLRVSNLSCYGYHRKTTPNIDAIAEQGALFEHAFSVGCWTLPVHASLFTGLFPINHGVTISKDALPENFPTLARHLQECGYQTVSFSNNAYISHITGLAQGFHLVEDIWRQSNPRGIRRTRMGQVIKFLERFGTPAKPIIYLARVLQKIRAVSKRKQNQRDKGARITNEKIQAWFREDRDPNRPFFMFVNYMEPHQPYNPPYPYDRSFMPSRFSPMRVAQVGNNSNVIEKIGEGRGQEDLEILRALYDGEVNYIDNRIGQLVRYLKSTEILDDTVLVITSDHGDSLGEHNHIGHRMALYEQLVHIPLIIRYPKLFDSSSRVFQCVSLLDLYPTFLELAGANVPNESMNGLFSLMHPPSSDERPFIIAENTAPKSQNSVIARMVRSDRYKYIWKSNHNHELYDIVRDPEELYNLTEAKPQAVEEMHEYLESWIRSAGEYRVEVGTAAYDEVLLERLRELGYVD